MELLILFAYFTGAPGRLLRMQWEGVDFGRRNADLHANQDRRESDHSASPRLLARLNKLAGTTRRKCSSCRTWRFTARRRHGFLKLQTHHAGKAGVDCQTVKGAGKRMISKRTFHACAIAYIALANKNVASELRMKLTGHKTAGEHQKYTHHEMDNSPRRREKNPVLGSK